MFRVLIGHGQTLLKIDYYYSLQEIWYENVHLCNDIERKFMFVAHRLFGFGIHGTKKICECKRTEIYVRSVR